MFKEHKRSKATVLALLMSSVAATTEQTENQSLLESMNQEQEVMEQTLNAKLIADINEDESLNSLKGQITNAAQEDASE